MKLVSGKPLFKRVRHFFSRIGVRFIGKSSRPRSVKIGNRTFSVPNVIEPSYLQFVAHGEYEIEVVEYLALQIGFGGTFIDVGANCGLISLQLAVLRPDLHFFCIEPNVQLIPYLTTNLSFCDSVKIIPSALSNSSGVSTLYIDDVRPGQSSMKFEVENSRPQTISTLSVEAFMQEILSIRPPDLAIKVDCEGMEHEILSSLLQIEDRVPLIVFESFERIRNYSRESRVVEMMENHSYIVEPILWQEKSPYMWSAKLNKGETSYG